MSLVYDEYTIIQGGVFYDSIVEDRQEPFTLEIAKRFSIPDLYAILSYLHHSKMNDTEDYEVCKRAIAELTAERPVKKYEIKPIEEHYLTLTDPPIAYGRKEKDD